MKNQSKQTASETELGQLRAKIAALEAECDRLRVEPCRKPQDLFEHTEHLAKLGHFEWDVVADRCTYCSKELAALHGLSVHEYFEQFSGTEADFREVHPDDRDRYRHAVAASRADGKELDIEYRLLRSDGVVLEVREVRGPIIDDNGKVVRSVGYVQDISELKRSERALHHSEQRFKDFALVSSHWLWEMGPDLRFTYISDGITRVTGEDPVDFIGKTRREIAGDILADAEALQANLEQMDRHEPFENFCFERPMTTGGRVCLSLSGKPVFDSGGCFLGYRGTANDVTEKINMLNSLQKTDALFKESERLAGLGHWEWDEVEDRCTYCSEELAQLLGVSVDEYLQQRPSLEADLEWIHPEDRERYHRVVTGAAEQRTGFEIEYRLLAKNGTTLLVREVAEPVLDENGSLIRSIGYVQDITERKKTEEELRKSEDRFAGAFNYGLVGIAILSPAGHFDAVNKAYCDFLGYTAEELIGQHFKNIIQPDDLRDVTERLQLLLAGEVEGYHHERRYRHKNGYDVWGRAALSALHHQDGSPRGFIVQVLDITERKRDEEALRENETLLTQAAQMANLGHWVWDEVEDRAVHCSKTLARMLGVTIEEYLARFSTMDALLSDVHPDDRDRYELTISEAKREVGAYDIEFRDLALNGEYRYLRERGEPVLDQNGKHVRTVGTMQDVTDYRRAQQALLRARNELEIRVEERTAKLCAANENLMKEIAERKRVEEELRESEERYRELFDDSPVAIWEEDWSPIKQMLDDLALGGVKDWRGYFNSHRDQLKTLYDSAKITEISSATVDIYRASSKEELIRSSNSLVVIDEELDAFCEIVLLFLAGQMAVDIESKDTCIGSPGIIIRRRVVIPPKYCDDWSRVIYAIEDITEQKKTQAQLLQSSKLATLGEMATGTAHELNQPLNVIRMAANNLLEHIKEGEVDARYLQAKIERIDAQTERAARIIDHMRIYGRKTDEKPEEFDPREVMDTVVDLVRHQLQQRRIEVEMRLPERCSRVLGHALQLEQVLLNLIANAWHAIEAKRLAPSDSRKISLVVEDAGAVNKVKLIVRDTGDGIPENIESRIFDPFFTTKKAGEGTGLGLSISYGIISDMGGTIDAVTLNDGAEFTIALPAVADWRADA